MMKCPIIIIFSVFGLIVTLGAQSKIAFRNVDVITMNDQNIQRDQLVLVSNGRIEFIGQCLDKTIPEDYQVIDAKGKYLTPGWSEMHAHIPVPKDGSDANVKETLFLYLANGITTIRGMLGNPYHLNLIDQVKENAFPSPRIYTSSPSLNGNSVKTKVEARIKVTQYKKEGYDFLKIHPGIQRDVFDELVKTARAVGIPFAGHVPQDVGIHHAIHSKYASIDHLDGYIEGLAPEAVRSEGGFFGVLLHDQLHENKIKELVMHTKQAGIAVVPTQTLMTRWLSPTPPAELANEPEMQYISAAQRFSWRQNKERLLNELKYSESGYNKFISIREKLIRAFHKAGVMILLGSDAPQVFNVPGFSIHHEMRDMASAGMTPFEILQSGTVNVAHFFDESNRFGSITSGKVADLVLLEKNPLEDIRYAKTIEGVMYRGHWLPKAEIQNQLSQIAHNYAE
jgi:imidazolonepropionase-like amidohydrolase